MGKAFFRRFFWDPPSESESEMTMGSVTAPRVVAGGGQ